MELELSLGVPSSKPFVDVAQKSTSKVPDLISYSSMGLSLPSKSTDGEVEDKDMEKHSSRETIKDKNPLLLSSDYAKYRGNVGNKRSLDDHGNQVVEGERRSNSKASDEDENGLTRKKLRLSKQQSAFLENSFKEHSSTLNPKQKHGALAKQLNLRPRQVEVWFQNRRARTKLKQTEVECEKLKKYFETLTKENSKLHKELQELRALKISSPFYMQSPATTLSTCPSCHERVATSTPVVDHHH